MHYFSPLSWTATNRFGKLKALSLSMGTSPERLGPFAVANRISFFFAKLTRALAFCGPMKPLLSLLFLSFTATLALAEIPADYYPRAVFSDDFSGTEFGKRWGHYKSSSVIKDGVLVGITAEDSDHSAVDNVKIDPERDLEVSVKFRFVSDKAKSFNLWA